MLHPRLVLVAATLSAFVALGEEPRAPTASVTLVGGAAQRSSRLFDEPGTSLSGLSPTVVRVRGDFFPLRWLGAELEVGTDIFNNKPDGAGVNEVWTTRLEGRAAVAARWLSSSGFFVSGSLGYALSSAPAITVVDGQAKAANLVSHGPAARLGLGLSLGRFDAQLGAAFMYGLGARVSTFEPRAYVGWRVFEAATLGFSVGADYGLLLEPNNGRYQGTAHRFGLALTLAVLPERPVAPLLSAQPSLRVVVHRPDASPAVGVAIALDGAAAGVTDDTGAFTREHAPGTVAVRATLEGFRVAEATTTLSSGEALVDLTLAARTGPGRLTGVVRAAATKDPVPDAQVSVGATSVRTGADGVFRVDACGPGPVAVRVEAQGFNAGEEVAQVPPEGEATLDVALETLGKGSPATLRGLVRAQTGEPLSKATVVIRGSETKVTVTADGRFVVTVPGGTYFLVISAPGYVAQTKKVVLADGDQAIFHAELQKVK